MKTYVLMISKHFPSTHIRKGERTGFMKKIFDGEKIHTIRGNYEFWKNRIDKITNGQAVLSIRQWEDQPYKSKQKEQIRTVSVGIQKVEINRELLNINCVVVDGIGIDLESVASNDGLTTEDFKEWFKKAPEEPMALIHFTKHRY